MWNLATRPVSGRRPRLFPFLLVDHRLDEAPHPRAQPPAIGSNQLSKSRPSASQARAVAVIFVMAWSSARRSNAGIRIANPGDYVTPFQSPQRRHHTVRPKSLLHQQSIPRRWRGRAALPVRSGAGKPC